MSNRRRRRTNPRPVLIILCAVLAVILALLVGLTIVAEGIFGGIGRVDPSESGTLSQDQLESIYNGETVDPGYTGETLDPGDIDWGTEPTVPVVDHPDIINILLIGTDGRYQGDVDRSDSMILCTFNTVNNTVVMTSFMRDMYVQIPNGYAPHRINTAYSLGGMALLKETLALNFGVHVDACVNVNFAGFPKIVDALGGVDIELTQEEADYLNANGNWGVWGGTGGGVWTLTGGMNHLNGEQTLAYSRIRAIGDDFGRTDRQRKVLSILLNQCKSMKFSTAKELLETFLPLVSTDMTNQQITSYAMALFPMLSDLNVTSQRVPKYGTYSNVVIDGMQVLLPDLPAIQQILRDTGVIYDESAGK